MVLKIFKFFDFYGESVKFTVFKNDVHKTHFGGLFSILVILSIICSCVYFGKDFYMRTNPYFNQQMFRLPNYPVLNINNSNFLIGFNFVYANISIDMGILTTMKRNYSLIGIDYKIDDSTSRDINESLDNTLMLTAFYLNKILTFIL